MSVNVDIIWKIDQLSKSIVKDVYMSFVKKYYTAVLQPTFPNNPPIEKLALFDPKKQEEQTCLAKVLCKT